jgi:hypothetical protein
MPLANGLCTFRRDRGSLIKDPIDPLPPIYVMGHPRSFHEALHPYRFMLIRSESISSGVVMTFEFA